jgi:hypothetical protein
MDADKHARMLTSKALRLTEHTFFERKWGVMFFACHECGNSRVYGNVDGHQWGGPWGGERASGGDEQ